MTPRIAVGRGIVYAHHAEPVSPVEGDLIARGLFGFDRVPGAVEAGFVFTPGVGWERLDPVDLARMGLPSNVAGSLPVLLRARSLGLLDDD